MLHIQVYIYWGTIYNSTKIRKSLNVYELGASFKTKGTSRYSPFPKIIHSRPLNNMGLNCMGSNLYAEFFNKYFGKTFGDLQQFEKNHRWTT